MFKRIDHVEIVTDQPDKTVAFYTEILGFTSKERDRIERSGLGVRSTSSIRSRRHRRRADHYERPDGRSAPRTNTRLRMIALEVETWIAPRVSETKGVESSGARASPDLCARRDPRPQRLPHRTAPVVPLTKPRQLPRPVMDWARYSGQVPATSRSYEKLLSVFGPKSC